MKTNYTNPAAAGLNQQGYTQFPYAGYNQAYGYPYTQPAVMPQVQQAPQIPMTPQLPGTTGGVNVPGMLPIEESYIENILRLNKGKIATIYMTFENNQEWNAKIFRGVIEAAGRDHIIISDPETGKRYLLLMIYLDYITFDEELVYEYPFG